MISKNQLLGVLLLGSLALCVLCVNASFALAQTDQATDKLQAAGDAVNKAFAAVLDSNSTTFDYQLVCELWLYNASAGVVEFNDRFVSLRVNLARSV